MVLSAEAKSRNGAKSRVKGDAWSCGCTMLYCAGDIEAECLKCGNIFTKFYPKRKHAPNDKLELNNLENVIEFNVENNSQEVLAQSDCDRCNNHRWIKAYTQEWDRIKCHHAPCPKCHSREWLEWSANIKLVMIK